MTHDLILNTTNVIALVGLVFLWLGIFIYSRISRLYEQILHERTYWRLIEYSLPFLMALPIIVLIVIYGGLSATGSIETFTFALCYFIGGIFAHIGTHDLGHALNLHTPKSLKKVFKPYLFIYLAIAILLVILAVFITGELFEIGSIALLAIGEIDMAFAFFVLATMVREKTELGKLYILPIIAGMLLPLDSILGAYGHVFLVHKALEGASGAIAQITLLRVIGMIIYLVSGLFVLITTIKYYKLEKSSM